MAEGHKPGSLVVVLDPALWDEMSRLWGGSGIKEMLGMLAQRDKRGNRWVVRVKS
jgi:hypothetical protein